MTVTGCFNEAKPHSTHVEIPHFTAEINMFTAWYKKQVWSLNVPVYDTRLQNIKP